MEILQKEFKLRSISSVYRAFELRASDHHIKNVELINRATELVQERAQKMNELSEDVRELLVIASDEQKSMKS